MKLGKYSISNPLTHKFSHTCMVSLFRVANYREIIKRLLVFGISSFSHVLCHFAKCKVTYSNAFLHIFSEKVPRVHKL